MNGIPYSPSLSCLFLFFLFFLFFPDNPPSLLYCTLLCSALLYSTLPTFFSTRMRF
ncbi:hypothetical protein GGR50DRAFT_649802 [Xylaria sp. CBS 124048]|nr:hypothetical protein GGR50DRAFT_649802 [Xylaria sp. CBS 124048]